MSDAMLRSDGAGFYQLVSCEYSFSAEKKAPLRQIFLL
ncbi:hypothetical protein EcCFBP13530_14510 [Enterobacter cancerogenus]|uniref:DUF2575 domain-containing protein n=1 Tax=Enterobacter cancerogenus TaxID=69218 RepID=A0AB38P3D5_9ENTR|nr:DUF2575 domain-containing protein [Enterobacter cancerogenus]QGG09630.1 DUF2575 domain-containing protein [Enterobacter cancerogenus]TKK17569.1 hypothetical protein EcCFBP13530_14510 [Enterobacter cancerogenus]